MLSIKGILDNKKLTLLEKIDLTTPREVIITFLEKDNSDVEFWSKEEIEKMGKTVLLVRDVDNEDYSKW